jgi:hypothetical protein
VVVHRGNWDQLIEIPMERRRQWVVVDDVSPLAAYSLREVHKTRRLGILLVMAAALLTACGRSSGEPASGSAGQPALVAAQAFEAAVRNHDASAACSDVTTATAQDMATDALISARALARAAASGCTGWLIEDSGLWNSTAPRDVSSTFVRGGKARVCFRRGGPTGSGECVALEHDGTDWLVDLTGPYSPRAVYANATYSSNDCIAAWNASTGETLPNLREVPSAEVWAGLSKNAGGSCSMSLRIPTELIEWEESGSAPGGPFTELDASTVDASSDLGEARTVWFSADGAATPLSQASPDGNEPALNIAMASQNTATTETTTSQSSQTTTSTQTAGITARTATAAQVAELTEAGEAAGVVGSGTGGPNAQVYLGDARVTNNGWAKATVLTRNPADQGNEDLIFRLVEGRWKYVTGGSSFGPIVPSAVVHALYG